MSRTFRTLFLMAILAGARQLNAALVVTASVSTTTQLTPGGYVVSSTDLINAGSATLATAVPNGGFNFGGYTVLNNGSAGAASTSGTMTDGSTGTGDSYVTYTLQGSASGYDIGEVNTIAGWTDQRINQTIQIDVATVSNPTFTPLAPTNGNFNSGNAYRYTPSFNASGSSTRLRFADSVNPGVAPIATGVTAIRIHILQFSPPTTEPGSYREFDVFGVASAAVPESAPMGLLAIGLVGSLLAWQQRRGASQR